MWCVGRIKFCITCFGSRRTPSTSYGDGSVVRRRIHSVPYGTTFLCFRFEFAKEKLNERTDGPTDGRTTVMLAAAAAAADIACKMKNRARIADRPDTSDERRRPNRDAKNDEVLSKNGLTFGESRRSGCHGHGEYMRTCMKTLPR